MKITVDVTPKQVLESASQLERGELEHALGMPHWAGHAEMVRGLARGALEKAKAPAKVSSEYQAPASNDAHPGEMTISQISAALAKAQETEQALRRELAVERQAQHAAGRQLADARRAAEYARNELRECNSERSIAARAYDELTLEVERCTGAEPIEAAAAVRRLHKERDVAVRECGALREQMMAMGVRAKADARAAVREEFTQVSAEIARLCADVERLGAERVRLETLLNAEQAAHAVTKAKLRRARRGRRT